MIKLFLTFLGHYFYSLMMIRHASFNGTICIVHTYYIRSLFKMSYYDANIIKLERPDSSVGVILITWQMLLYVFDRTLFCGRDHQRDRSSAFGYQVSWKISNIQCVPDKKSAILVSFGFFSELTQQITSRDGCLTPLCHTPSIVSF